MNESEITSSILEKIPPNVLVVLLVILIVLWVIDKGGYYIKRKGTNGKGKNGAQTLALELVKQLGEIAQKPDENGDTKFIPGFSPTCVKHGEDLVEIKTELPHIKTGIDEIKANQEATGLKLDKIQRGINGGT